MVADIGISQWYLTTDRKEMRVGEYVMVSCFFSCVAGQNSDMFHERTKEGMFSLEDKDDGDSNNSEDREIVTEVAEADASVDNDSIVVGVSDTDVHSELASPSSAAQRQHSTTEYLPGMVHSNSPVGLLPKFPSWSLVLLGDYSSYNAVQGEYCWYVVHDQFIDWRVLV